MVRMVAWFRIPSTCRYVEVPRSIPRRCPQISNVQIKSD